MMLPSYTRYVVMTQLKCLGNQGWTMRLWGQLRFLFKTPSAS